MSLYTEKVQTTNGLGWHLLCLLIMNLRLEPIRIGTITLIYSTVFHIGPFFYMCNEVWNGIWNIKRTTTGISSCDSNWIWNFLTWDGKI